MNLILHINISLVLVDISTNYFRKELIHEPHTDAFSKVNLSPNARPAVYMKWASVFFLVAIAWYSAF